MFWKVDREQEKMVNDGTQDHDVDGLGQGDRDSGGVVSESLDRNEALLQSVEEVLNDRVDPLPRGMVDVIRTGAPK